MAAKWGISASKNSVMVLSEIGRKEMFYLMTHSTHFIYGYMASNIWLRTILIVRKETRCRHISYSFRLTSMVLLYAPSYRQDCTYHNLCYTSHGALAGTRNSSMGPPHEGSIRWPIAPWANSLTTELHLAPLKLEILLQIFGLDVVSVLAWWISFALNTSTCLKNGTSASVLASAACCPHSRCWLGIAN